MSSETFLATFGLIGYSVWSNGTASTRGALLASWGSRRPPSRTRRRACRASWKTIGFEEGDSADSRSGACLRAAECWHPSHLGTLGYGPRNVQRIAAHGAQAAMARYSRILGRKASLQVRRYRRGLCFGFDTGRGDAPVGHAVADFALSLIAFHVPDQSPARRWHLSPPACGDFPLPANRQPYDDFFGCRVAFGAAETASFAARHITGPAAADRRAGAGQNLPMPSSPTSWRKLSDNEVWRAAAGAYFLQELTSS
ncbi:MAG: AraC family transcriptional regulator ligand-binding domain-containing protein [Rhodocyclales bacterium]|nr:AraC family transcriptional regulator ligand-binding domain-containing protein [Rhodocyclales bacterium]